jgi:hypothetical protein
MEKLRRYGGKYERGIESLIRYVQRRYFPELSWKRYFAVPTMDGALAKIDSNSTIWFDINSVPNFSREAQIGLIGHELSHDALGHLAKWFNWPYQSTIEERERAANEETRRRGLSRYLDILRREDQAMLTGNHEYYIRYPSEI